MSHILAFRRRDLLTMVWMVSLVLAGCAPSAPAPPAALTPVTVCYSALTATQIPVLYAKDTGAFKAQGLAVDLTYIESGTSAATAMIAGSVDLCEIAGSSVVNADIAGQDLVFVGGLFNTYVYSFLVAKDITTADQLRGQSVAVSRIGSSSDAAMRAALESFGLKPDQDVTILELGGQSQRVAALESGQVAGTVVSIPDSSRGTEAGFHELLNMSTLNAPYQHTALATSRSYIQGHREVVVAFMRAMVEAIRHMKSDRQGTMDVIAKELKLDPQTDADLIAASYDQLVPTYLQDVPEPSLEGIQTLIDQAKADNPAAANYRADQMVDTTILRDAMNGLNGQ